MKRKNSFIVLCLILVLSCSTVFASSSNNIGVSTIPPANPLIGNRGEISINSTEMPSKTNLYTNGVDETVYGEAYNQNLYSNNCFKGVTSISYAIHNASSKQLKVVLRKYTSIGQTSVKTIKISGKSTQYGAFEKLDSTTYYFLDFYPPSNFDGTVRGKK